MSTQKKTWVKSMFSQLSHLENNNSPKPQTKKVKDDTRTSQKRSTRKGSTITETIFSTPFDLDAKDNAHNNEVELQTTSTFLERTTNTDAQISKENWIDVFAPTNKEDLAIHPKKLQEIEQWFQHCAAMKRKNPAQLCLLTGPSGCGKTAAIRTLTKENKTSLQERINPVDHDSSDERFNAAVNFTCFKNNFKNYSKLIISACKIMSTQKKTWVKSMFSQLSHLENNNSPKPQTKKVKDDTRTSQKRSTRKGSTITETIFSTPFDLDAKDNAHNNEVELQTTSTFLERTTNTDAQISKENWIDVFAPTNKEDLAIHPKKLQEIEQWFQHCAAMKRKNPAQLCLLTGPSGCGKTAAIRTLTKENKTSLQEWINPVDQDVVYSLGDQLYGKTFVSSQVDAFKNFLFKASRYRSLLETNTTNKRLLMVEDFPNFLLRDPSTFQEILEEYVNSAKSPLIFIVTDAKTRSLNISYNLFTDQIKQQFLINHISLNAIASTIMQKAMKRFCTLMRLPPHCEIYKSPSSDIINSIILSAQGDIRNALINLHFSSLKGAPSLLTKRLLIPDEPKTSRKRKYQSTLKSVGRDESVTMMHALGRVFNPKFTEKKNFLHSPEELAEAFITEPKKFIDLVQANYILHFRDIEYVLEAADGLSICDVILNEYRDDSLALTALNVAIRSVMEANKNPATGWLPIKGQKRIDSNTSKIPIKASKVLPENHNISTSLYALDYKTFINVISPK